MKSKFVRACFIAGMFAALSGCVVYDEGEDYGVSYGDDYYDPAFYDPWYAGGYPAGGGGGIIVSSPPPRPANLPASGARPSPR